MTAIRSLTGLGLALAVAGPALAGNCAARAELVQRLQAKYAEELAMAGLQTTSAEGAMMEVWASADTGTFTVLLTQPNGISCIVAAGTDFFVAAPGAPKAKGTAG